MKTIDLLISARWVIPVEPEGLVLENHSVAVHDGRIVGVMPTAAAMATYAASVHVERPGHALLPGLVNAHTHAAMTLFRGLADDLPLEAWLKQHIWPAESLWVGADFVRDGAELAILEMIRGGTTCFSDMYFFPDIVARVAAENGLRASVGMIVLEFPTVWARNPDEYLSKGLEIHDQYRDHRTIRTTFAPHAPYTVSDQTFRQVRVLADELDLPVFMHVHESASEIAESIRDHDRRPLTRLDDLGLVSPLLAAIHMTQLTAAEIDRLSERRASVVHCPESNLKLASGTCPVATLLARGVNVALGTDGAASNNDLDMFGEMRTAALLGKVTASDAAALPAAAALSMATINGARALGIADRIGSITEDKEADMICVDFAVPATQPVYHPVSQIVYAAGRDQVSDVWVAGKALLTAGEFTMAKPDRVFASAEAWRARIAEK
jgi:5-methylthioadenosine/S-adenosylhomocysteine deaminase